jgi:hypothetical protein
VRAPLRLRRQRPWNELGRVLYNLRRVGIVRFLPWTASGVATAPKTPVTATVKLMYITFDWVGVRTGRCLRSAETCPLGRHAMSSAAPFALLPAIATAGGRTHVVVASSYPPSRTLPVRAATSNRSPARFNLGTADPSPSGRQLKFRGREWPLRGDSASDRNRVAAKELSRALR